MKCTTAHASARFDIPFKEYTLETIKHAAFAQTGKAFARISRDKTCLVVELELKDSPTRKALDRLIFDFKEELSHQALRSTLAAQGKELKEHIIKLALQGEISPVKEPEIGLTTEQQAELDRLIAEVEAEIAKESSTKQADPLGVAKTWEETHGNDKKSKKAPKR